VKAVSTSKFVQFVAKKRIDDNMSKAFFEELELPQPDIYIHSTNSGRVQ